MNKKLQRFKNNVIFVVVSFSFAVIKILPRSLGLKFFEIIGTVFHAIPTSDRRRTREHALQHLDFIKTQKDANRFSLKVYRAFVKNVYDAWYLSHATDEIFEKNIRVENFSEFSEAYFANNGVIVISAHLGCFELLLHSFARKGINSFTVGRKLYDDRIDKIAQEIRSGKNITYLDRDGSAKKIIKFLKSGKAFGVLIDQDTKLEGVFAHFLNELAYTPSAPVRIAMKFNIPVFVATISRQKDNTHIVKIEKQIDILNTGDFNKDLCLNIEKINKIMSDAILQNPEEWVWMHRRWRRTPTSKNYENIPNVEDYVH